MFLKYEDYYKELEDVDILSTKNHTQSFNMTYLNDSVPTSF